ncbi:O-antigen ligase family protein [Budviciaceae bacterium CWB-B4]|uniref:O-antigen ligase family protein n=1 Tax=Limnobaculum xujianqingii TaxID=2738837 RepID=A0A9D7FZ72_9GAMM|nr:O-antigen ligase family protein [Limnobaculum xujianqingii]MBK5074192.1 O-antigen ligase family protein [Limnobaculum xujianqingii]MBK5177501.1 O-antigen ligase family protein [Limnobaculum xujianqingii]
MKSKLYQFNEAPVIVFLASLVLSFALPYDTVSRYALYIAFYLSVIYIFIRRNSIRNRELILPLVIILFGVFEILWAELSKSIEYNIVNIEYIRSAKRMISCAVILFHLISIKNRVGKKTLFLCGFMLFTSYFYLSFSGIYYYMQTGQRIGFGMAATIGGYIYTVQALLVMYIVSVSKIKYSDILLIVLALFTFYVVIMTETRAIIIIYPFCVFLLFIKSKIINIKSLLVLTAFVAAGVGTNLISLQPIISRMDSTVYEVNAYQGGAVGTSLGARFSLWKAGLHIISEHPYGVSADERNMLAREYIIKEQYSNPTALSALEFHLHNDIINIGSLQGVAGILFLLIFYISMIYYSAIMTKSVLVSALLMIPTIFFGLSDTLLYSNKYMYVMLLSFVFYFLFTCIKNRDSQEENKK